MFVEHKDKAMPLLENWFQIDDNDVHSLLVKENNTSIMSNNFLSR